MKRFFKWVGILLAVVLLAAGGFYGWASYQTSSLLARTFETHLVDFPVPFPLTPQEVAALRAERARGAGSGAEPGADPAAEPGTDPAAEAGADPAVEAEPPVEAGAEPEPGTEGETAADPAADPLEGVDLDVVARSRAVTRGQHLVEARYACVECHGRDFGGGVMIDDPMIGTLLGPNITAGEGGRTRDYEPSDWDRIVRHGVLPDGLPAAMPSEDYVRMTDQELSDIIAYIRSLPNVDKTVARPSLGPLGTVLMALGKIPLSADRVPDHQAEHEERPPRAEPTAEFGRHLAAVCTGCHREHFEGGPIAAGPPDWAEPRNLTPHEQGLAGWEYEDFVRAMREGKRKDGSDLRVPMSLMRPYAEAMTDVELQALWAYMQSLEPRPTGQ